ncbi:MAG: class II fructose-bisphosphatase [Candidatus Magasanikbacteria bacterium]|nr:class II fructose-bisphosphatase [Candidatus Magasanikbacteria bacterium]
MDRNLALEFVRVTEAAAIAAAGWIGRGDAKAADQAAVDEMRDRFKYVPFQGVVVIGEGAKDEAPELYVGEKLGDGTGPELDIAVDPLECTDSVANGRPNAMAVIATGKKGSLFHAPDTYMNKIACGPQARGVIDLDASVEENIGRVAEKLEKSISDMVLIALDRPYNQEIIEEVRRLGARIRLIPDGDVAGAIATCLPDSGIDLLIQKGASAEGVLAAVAIKALGGDFQGRLAPKNDEHLARVKAMGITDVNKKLLLEDLAAGDDLTFTATGVIDGPLLKGVRYTSNYCLTHSVVIRAKSGTVRFLETQHRLKNNF